MNVKKMSYIAPQIFVQSMLLPSFSMLLNASIESLNRKEDDEDFDMFS